MAARLSLRDAYGDFLPIISHRNRLIHWLLESQIRDLVLVNRLSEKDDRDSGILLRLIA